MNRLTLCQALVTESDINGTMSTTISQTGELLRVVNWIDRAYNRVQKARKTWRFARTDISITLTSGTAAYTDATIANWRPDDFRIYLTSSGVSDEVRIGFVEYNDFREQYYIGSNRSATGRPTIFSIQPDNDIIFYPTPDDSYTCQAEGYIVSDTMTANADVPIFPSDFHMMLVWKGLMSFGAYNAEQDKASWGEYNYIRMLRQMEMEQLEVPQLGEPLA